MKHSSLVAFLNGEMPPPHFADEITAEVDQCTYGLKFPKNGRIVITEGPETVVTQAHIKRLLGAIADKTLSPEAASYVADCMIMSDSFDFGDDDLVLEAIHFAADGDNHPLPEDEVRGLLSRLR